jgi:galactokinase
MEEDIRIRFQQWLHNEFRIFTAPGRVNLIGEHTDYNQGFVLPAAINRNIYAAVTRNEENRLNVRALEFNEYHSFSLNDMHPVKGWPTYLLGMIHMLMPEKKLPYGMDFIISGNLPIGAGMSSSAALCCAIGVSLNETFRLGISKMNIALAAQQTEHRFAGLQCGIMDQFASMFGKAGHLMKLDCRSMEYEYIPFDFPDISIVLVNSMVSHSLAGSEYNLRRQQCEAGVSVIQNRFPGIHSLRDVTMEQLESLKSEMDDLVYKRCRFVVEENNRLLEGCRFLVNRNLDGFGKLMFEAHEGLSKDYEVSCTESDFLVNAMKKMNGVKGARQMGGGFGGCIITLVEKNSSMNFINGIKEKYKTKFGMDPDCYEMNIGDGAHIIQP